jgi:hypothetical protein
VFRGRRNGATRDSETLTDASGVAGSKCRCGCLVGRPFLAMQSICLLGGRLDVWSTCYWWTSEQISKDSKFQQVHKVRTLCQSSWQPWIRLMDMSDCEELRPACQPWFRTWLVRQECQPRIDKPIQGVTHPGHSDSFNLVSDWGSHWGNANYLYNMTLLVNVTRLMVMSMWLKHQLPSGYVKIAIENGHRNSEFSH